MDTYRPICIFTADSLVCIFAFGSSTSQADVAGPQLHRFGGSEVRNLDSQQVQSYLNSAVVSLDAFRHDKNESLLIIIGVTIGIVGFLGWSTFMLGQIKREVDHVA